MTRCAKNHRPGMALLVVVVLTMLIALAAYRFSFYMESQYRLTRLHEEQVHAKLAALSGIELAASMAELPVVERASLGGVFDNPAMLRHVAVDGQTDASSRTEQVSTSWRFGLLSPRAALSSSNASGGSSSGTGSVGTDSGQSDHLRFGFENESAKLHLPTLLEWDRKSPGHARATLLALPGATESLVDAWLRGLGVKKRGQGANGESALLDRLESSSQDSEQRSSTDPLKTLWLGGDFNQNYQLEPLELRLSEQLFSRRVTRSRAATLTTAQPLAWQRFVTWQSGQRNETRSGQSRINLNDTNLQALHQKLAAAWPADWANFVIAIRQYGPSATNTPAASDTALALTALAFTESPTPDFTKPASYTVGSPLELVGAVVQIPVANPPSSSDGKGVANTKHTLRNPFSSDLSEVRNYLVRVLDVATTDASPFTTGRVDVTEAPAEVLAGIPGVDSALAQRIVQQRSSNSGASSAESRDTIAWLLDSGAVDLAKLKLIEPYITSRNDVYSLQSVGYRDQLSPVYRCTVTIDARQIPARISNHQYWHPWDRGFTMDQLNSPAL